jgi:hypothetical protein
VMVGMKERVGREWYPELNRFEPSLSDHGLVQHWEDDEQNVAVRGIAPRVCGYNY